MSKRLKTISFDDYLAEQMRDPTFKHEYAELETEFSIRKQLIDMRLTRGLSQAQLAEKVGTPRPSISRMEAHGVKDLDFARRLADALDCTLEVHFVPKEEAAKTAKSHRKPNGSAKRKKRA